MVSGLHEGEVSGPAGLEGAERLRRGLLDAGNIAQGPLSRRAGTDANMFAELESAYQRKAPILLWIYSPHWAVAKYEGEWVEFPEYTNECYNDPAWGMNKDMAYDCGKPFGEIWKYAWAGMKDKWPVAYNIAKNYQFEAAEMNALISQVDLDGTSLEEVATAWVAANQDKIKKWAGQ